MLEKAVELVDVKKFDSTKGRTLGNFMRNFEGKHAFSSVIAVQELDAFGLKLSQEGGTKLTLESVLRDLQSDKLEGTGLATSLAQFIWLANRKKAIDK